MTDLTTYLNDIGWTTRAQISITSVRIWQPHLQREQLNVEVGLGYDIDYSMGDPSLPPFDGII